MAYENSMDGMGNSPIPSRALPEVLMDVLNSTGWVGKNFCRMRAKLAGYTILWQPKNPRWCWNMMLTFFWITGMILFLVGLRRAGYAWDQPLNAMWDAVGWVVFFWPFPSIIIFPLLVRRWERQRRQPLNAELFLTGLREKVPGIEAKAAEAVRYAIAKVGNFAEGAVRKDECAITFRRLTLIRYPLLHEFAYYVSEKLYQIDPVALGDFLSERPRRTIADLIAGVQEFIRTGRDRDDAQRRAAATRLTSAAKART